MNWFITPPPLVISEETTRIIGPLTGDGYIDFLKALEDRFFPPELAADDNGYRDFVRLFGDVAKWKEEDREFYRLQLYERLGLDPDVPQTLVLPDSPLKIVEDRPWTVEKYPALAGWVNEVDVPLDAIAELLRKPVFFPPYLASPGEAKSRVPPWLMPGMIIRGNNTLQISRSIVENFSARAGYRIGQGDIDGAIDDKLSILRLGRLLSRQGFLMEWSGGAAFERTALSIPVGANPEHPLTERQICRILAGLDALPPRLPFTETVEWQRYVLLSCIQVFMVGDTRELLPNEQRPKVMEISGGTPGLDGLSSLFLRAFNWNTVFRRVNEAFDAILEPPPRTKLASLMNEIAVPDGTWKQVPLLLYYFSVPGGKDTLAANSLIDTFVNATVNAEGRVQKTECLENMQRLVLAILLYQMEHRKMPDENWATQIEKYLGENPEQYFSCPLNPSAKGETVYAMVQYGNITDDTTGDTAAGSLGAILLIELPKAVPLDKAVISVDKVLEEFRQRKRLDGDSHDAGMNVALRNGAVRFLSPDTEEAELLRMLGQEGKAKTADN